METARLVVALTTNLSTLAALLLKQNQDNRAKVKILRQIQESTEQLNKVLHQILEGGTDSINAWTYQLQELGDVLPSIHADLSHAGSRKQIEDVLGRLCDQAEKLQPSDSLNFRVPQKTDRRYVLASSLEQDVPDRQKPTLISVYEPPDALPRADIILVHGLNTSMQKTWTTNGRTTVFWPKELLAGDLSDCAIWAYTYNADISQMLTQNLPLAEVLRHQTMDLIECVNNKARQRQQSGAPFRRAVWITHSLGGLLVKHALVVNESLEKAQQLNFDTTGILFFGTPHNGSSFVARSLRFTNIASLLSGTQFSDNRKSWNIEHLHDSTLTDVSAAFVTYLDRHLQLRVVSFFETDLVLTENGPRLVVEPFAKLSHYNEAVERLSGDHITMCKFEAREEVGYQRMLHHVRRFIGTSGTQLQQPDQGRSKSPSTGKSSISDAETTDIATIYARLRAKIDCPAARWTSAKGGKSNNGRWFVEQYDFSEWIRWIGQRSSRPILIRGPTGCGKTMIAESVMEELRAYGVQTEKAFETCYLHYFYSSSHLAQQSATAILCGFIAQVLDQKAELVRHLRISSEDLKHDDWISQGALSGTLRRILEDSCWDRVYVIVDGLDECSQSCIGPSYELFNWILDITKVRMIMTSSDDRSAGISHTDGGGQPVSSLYDRIDRTLQVKGTPFEVIDIQKQEGWQKALRGYITIVLALNEDEENQTNEWRAVSLSSRQKLLEAFTDMPNITFTLVDIMLEHLLHDRSRNWQESDDDAIRRQLRQLSELSNVYGILAELARRQEWPCISTICILQCTLEPLRPLEVSVLLHFMKSAHECDAETLQQVNADLTDKLSTADMRRLISIDREGLELSSNLVKITVQKQMIDSEKNRLAFAEKTEISDGFTEPARMHFNIARACLRLLIQSAKSAASDQQNPSRSNFVLPGLAYAKNHWRRHLREAGTYEAELNELLEQYYERYPKPKPGGAKRSSTQYGKLFQNLSQDNLSQTLLGVFSEASVADIPSANEVESLVTEFSRSLDRETLNTMGMLALRKSRAISEPDTKPRVTRKLQLSDDIEHGLDASRTTPPDYSGQLQLLKPTSKEVIEFLKLAIKTKNLLAFDSIMLKCPQKVDIASQRDLLTLAVESQDGEFIRQISKYRKVFNLSSSFIAAVKIANMSICADLLARGADVNALDGDGSPALHLAATSGLNDLVKLLLSWNASVNKKDGKGRTALHIVAESGRDSTAQLLLQNSSHLAARDTLGRTPFFVACARGHPEMVRMLWFAGAELDQSELGGRSPLHAATRNGHLEVVRILIRAGISPSVTDSMGITPLHEAAEHGWAPIVNLLLESGASVHCCSIGNAQPLHFACTSINAPETVVQKLLNNGADPTARDAFGRTPVLIAAHFCSLRVLIRLLSYGPQMKQHRDLNGYGLEDYANSRVVLSAFEKGNKSGRSRRELQKIRTSYRISIIKYLGYNTKTLHDSQSWKPEDLRSMIKAQKELLETQKKDEEQAEMPRSQIGSIGRSHLKTVSAEVLDTETSKKARRESQQRARRPIVVRTLPSNLEEFEERDSYVPLPPALEKPRVRDFSPLVKDTSQQAKVGTKKEQKGGKETRS